MTFRRTEAWAEVGGPEAFLDEDDLQVFNKVIAQGNGSNVKGLRLVDTSSCVVNAKTFYKTLGSPYLFMRPDEESRVTLKEQLAHVQDCGNCMETIQDALTLDRGLIGFSSHAYNRQAFYEQNAERLLND